MLQFGIWVDARVGLGVGIEGIVVWCYGPACSFLKSRVKFRCIAGLDRPQNHRHTPFRDMGEPGHSPSLCTSSGCMRTCKCMYCINPVLSDSPCSVVQGHLKGPSEAHMQGWPCSRSVFGTQTVLPLAVFASSSPTPLPSPVTHEDQPGMASYTM